MSVEVTVRHIDANDHVQRYAREKADALCEDFPRVEHVHVILDGEKRNKVAEVVVQGRNHIRVEAKESCENMQASIDAAFDKVEKQLRKLRDKVQDHKAVMKNHETLRERSEG